VPTAGLAHGPGAGALRRSGGGPHDPLGGSPVGPEINGALARLQGRGRPLPESVAGAMGQAMGADLAYIGSAFIATAEARASDAYKQCIVDSNSDDIVYSSLFTGVHGNYLKHSVVAAGLDPDNLPTSDPSKMSFGTDSSGERAKPKAWKEIWGSGQGIGAIKDVLPAAELIARFKKEYDEAIDPPL